MTEVFVIEKMIAVGIWELLSNKAYKNERKALDDCEHVIKFMQKTNKNFAARVTKLLINKD